MSNVRLLREWLLAADPRAFCVHEKVDRVLEVDLAPGRVGHADAQSVLPNGEVGGLHYPSPLAVEGGLEREELRIQEPLDRRLADRERRPVERELDGEVGDEGLGL